MRYSIRTTILVASTLSLSLARHHGHALANVNMSYASQVIPKVNQPFSPRDLFAFPDRKAIFCVPPKNGWDAIIHLERCYEYGDKRPFGPNHHRVLSLEEYMAIIADPSWFKAYVVREPLERLLSGFRDKCEDDIRYPCSDEFDFPEGQHISFEEAVEQLVHTSPNKENNLHFEHQHKFCGGSDVLTELYDEKYQFNGTTYTTDIEKLFKEAGLFSGPKKAVERMRYCFDEIYVTRNVLPDHAKHAHDHLVEYYNNHALAEQVMKYYEKDYEIFNISHPEWLKLIPE